MLESKNKKNNEIQNSTLNHVKIKMKYLIFAFEINFIGPKKAKSLQLFHKFSSERQLGQMGKFWIM